MSALRALASRIRAKQTTIVAATLVVFVVYQALILGVLVVGMLTIGVLGMLSSLVIRLLGARCMPWLPRREKAGA